jgi:hypothetical protein
MTVRLFVIESDGTIEFWLVISAFLGCRSRGDANRRIEALFRRESTRD